VISRCGLFVAFGPARDRSRTNLAKRFAWWPCDGRDLVRARLPWPGCLFLAVTGHPCLTCGATRSTIALFHLDFSGAWKWNPLVFSFLCGLSIFDLYAFAVLVTRAPRLRIVQFTQLEKNFVRLAVIVAFAVELDLFAFASARLVLNPRQTASSVFVTGRQCPSGNPAKRRFPIRTRTSRFTS